MIIGAIAGDIIGSPFEGFPPGCYFAPDVSLFRPEAKFTDDTVLTCAIAYAILNKKPYDETLKSFAKEYPQVKYGGNFLEWVDGGPNNSWGNGCVMRTSPMGYLTNINEILYETGKQAATSHAHPFAVEAAQGVAYAIFLARQKKLTKEEFYILPEKNNTDMPKDGYDYSAKGTTHNAMCVIFNSVSYEDAIIKAVNLGGDTDTLACVVGGIAEAKFGLPKEIKKEALSRLDSRLRDIAVEFKDRYVWQE